MAITFVNVGTGGGGTSGNATATLPTNWAQDDVAILQVVSRDNVAHTVPGWANYFSGTNGANENFSVWWRRLQTGDTNVVVTHSAGSAIAAQIIAFRGCYGAGAGPTASSPFDPNSAVSISTCTGSSNVVAGITCSGDNEMVVCLYGHGHATNGNEARAYTAGGVTTTATTIFRAGSSTTRAVCQFAYGPDSSGSTGNQTFTLSTVTGTTTYPANSMLVALKPVPTGPVFTSKVSGTNGAGARTVSVAGLTTSGPSLLLIHVGWEDNVTNTVQLVTVNGVSATLQGAVENGGSTPFIGSGFWSLWSTGALSNVTTTADFGAGALPFAVIQVVEASGTDNQSIVSSVPVTGTGTTRSASLTVTDAAATSRVIAGFSNVGVVGSSGTNATTTVLNELADGNGNPHIVAYDNQTESSGSAYTVGVGDFGGSYKWAGTAIEVRAPAAPAGPVLDSGSAFPLSTNVSGAAGSVTTITRAGVTTNGAGLIVAVGVVGGNSEGTALSMSGGGLTWSRVTQTLNPTNGSAEIWAAWSTGALSNQTITLTRSSTVDGWGGSLTIWAYVSSSVKDGSTSVANCFGAHGGTILDGQVSASLTGVITSSVILGAFTQNQSSAVTLTALANTNWRGFAQGTGGSLGSAYTADTAGNTVSGSVVVGASTSATYITTVAAELLYGTGSSTTSATTSAAAVSGKATLGGLTLSGNALDSADAVQAAASVGAILTAVAEPLSAVSAQSSVGALAAKGSGSVSLPAISAQASVGAVSANGGTIVNASTALAAVQAACAVAALAESGNASASAIAIAARATLGTVAESGGAAAPAPAVTATSSVGSTSGKGTASTSIPAVSAAAAVAALIASAGTNATAAISAIQAKASLGLLFTSGAGTTQLQAIAARGDVGNVGTSADAAVAIPAVQAVASASAVTAILPEPPAAPTGLWASYRPDLAGRGAGAMEAGRGTSSAGAGRASGSPAAGRAGSAGIAGRARRKG